MALIMQEFFSNVYTTKKTRIAFARKYYLCETTYFEDKREVLVNGQLSKGF